MTYLLLQLTVLLYLYVLGIILTEKIVQSLELFVLRTGYDKAVSLLKHEPHYPWYLSAIRHLFVLFALLASIALVKLDVKTSFFLPQIVVLFGVLVLLSYVAALFWHLTSMRIDRRFHQERGKRLKTMVCQVRNHALFSPKRHYQASVTLFLFSLFLVLTSGIFWTLLWRSTI